MTPVQFRYMTRYECQSLAARSKAVALPLLASLALGACGQLGENRDSLSSGDSAGSQHSSPSAAGTRPRWNPASPDSYPDFLSDDTRAAIRRMHDPEFYSTLSPASYRWLGQEIRTRIDDEAGAAGLSGTRSFFALRSSSEDWETSLKLIREEYEQRRQENEFGTDLVKATRDLVTGTIKAGTVAAGVSGVGLPESLALAAVSDSTERSFNQVLALYQQDADQAARDYLALKFQGMPEKAWQQWESLADRSPDEARALAARQIEKWSKLAGADGNTADAAVVKASFDGFLLKAVVGELASEQSLSKLRDREVHQSIDALENRIKAVGGAIAGYSEETNRRLQLIVDGQTQIASQLREMKGSLAVVSTEIEATHGDVLDIRQNVGFLSNFMFSRMSAQEQKAALEAGFAHDMPAVEREKLAAKVDLVAKREKIESDVAQVLNGAQTLIDVGAKVGVDPKVLASAQQVVSAVSPAVSVIGAVATGNWMEAVQGVGSLLGLGGPTEAGIAQARHEQVMEALGAISDGQEVLFEGQKALLEQWKVSLEMQAEILKTQKETIDGLVALSDEVSEYHREVMSQLDRIQQELLINRSMIREIGLKDFEDCGTFLGTRRLKSSFSVSSGEFADASDRRTHFAEYTPNFSHCVQGLTDLIQSPGFSKVFLFNSVYSEAGESIEQFDQQIFEPARSLLTEIDSKKPAQWIALSLPVEKTRAVDVRLKSIRETLADQNLAIPFDTQRFSMPIASDALKPLVEELLQLLPYLDLVDFTAGAALPSFESIFLGQDSRAAATRPMALLQSAMGLVNIGIAQEAMIAGNGILPDLLSVVESHPEVAAPCEKIQSRSHPSCILAHNPILARNLVVYGLGHDLKARGHSLYSYEFARNYRNDDHLLKLVLGKGWKFEQRAGEWNVILGGRAIQLPDEKELNDDRMQYRSTLHELVALRSRLAGKLAEIQMMRDSESGVSADLEGLLFSGL